MKPVSWFVKKKFHKEPNTASGTRVSHLYFEIDAAILDQPWN